LARLGALASQTFSDEVACDEQSSPVSQPGSLPLRQGLAVSDSAQDVIARCRSTLRHAELALGDITGASDPARRAAAVNNVLVWGRAVTPILQQLRSRVEGFDAWYESWQQEMRQDPLLSYLYKLRNRLLKQGENAVAAAAHITYLNTSDLPPPPENAVSFFVFDEFGGVGWEVDLPDGSRTKIYAALPESVLKTWLVLPDAPQEHLGVPLFDQSAGHVCELYVAYLKRLVLSAEQTFAVS
jgi:hypothetical protein